MSEYNGEYLRLDNVIVWTDGIEIVIEGEPPDEAADPNCEAHHCDAMGCGRRHILFLAPLPSSGGVALGYVSPEPEANRGPSEALLKARERQRAAGNDVVYPFRMPDE